jgi:hypothetical protein
MRFLDASTRFVTLALLAAITAPCGTAVAQTHGVLAEASGGPSDVEVEPVRSLFEITGGTDSSKATLRVGTQLSRPHSTPDPNGKTPFSQFTTLALTLAGPLDKSDDFTDLATLDGLENAVTAAVKANVFLIHLRNPSDDPDYKNIEDQLTKAMIAAGALKEGEFAQVDASNVEKYLGKSALEKFYGYFYDDSGAWIFGGEGKVGSENFKYRSGEEFTERSSRRTPWSIDAHGAYSHPRFGLTTVGFRFEQAWKDASDKSVCSPIEGSDKFDCKTGPDGRPDKKISEILFVSWRRQLHIPGLAKIKLLSDIAVAPKISYDFDEDTVGIDVPIYLWGTESGLLNGGVRVGYRNDTDDTTFAVFVGSTFDYFN